MSPLLPVRPGYTNVYGEPLSGEPGRITWERGSCNCEPLTITEEVHFNSEQTVGDFWLCYIKRSLKSGARHHLVFDPSRSCDFLAPHSVLDPSKTKSFDYFVPDLIKIKIDVTSKFKEFHHPTTIYPFLSFYYKDNEERLRANGFEIVLGEKVWGNIKSTFSKADKLILSLLEDKEMTISVAEFERLIQELKDHIVLVDNKIIKVQTKISLAYRPHRPQVSKVEEDLNLLKSTAGFLLSTLQGYQARLLKKEDEDINRIKKIVSDTLVDLPTQALHSIIMDYIDVQVRINSPVLPKTSEDSLPVESSPVIPKRSGGGGWLCAPTLVRLVNRFFKS